MWSLLKMTDENDDVQVEDVSPEESIATHLTEISQYLMPGTLLTLVARLPEKEEGDYILSNDSLEEAKNVINRHLDKNPLVGLDGKTL